MKIIIPLLLLSIFISTALRVSAHSGDGPPFVKIDNQYAATNPYFANLPENSGMVIAQDLTPQKFLVNDPITIEIDVDRMMQFGLDKDEATTAVYLWKVYKGENFQIDLQENVEGTSLSKTFTNPGSYLLTLELQRNKNTRPELLDTIRLDVLPEKNHVPPITHVNIASSLAANSPSTFSNTTTGNELSFLWSFEGGDVQKGKSLQKTYEQKFFFDVVIARTVDRHGIHSDFGILTFIEDGKIEFSLLDPKEDKKRLVVNEKKSSLQLILMILGINLLVIFSLIVIVKLKKPHQK